MNVIPTALSTQKTPTDQAQRDRIMTDTDRTLFVEAGAGSGKTRSLVDRVETLVLHKNVTLRSIAVVTFTIKAAAELRDRLRTRLQNARRRAEHFLDDTTPSAAAPTTDDTPLSLNSTDDAALLLQRSNEALADLDSAMIGTLHSFAQHILTLHPIEAGLPPLIEVLDDLAASALHQEAWERVRSIVLDDPDMAAARTLAFDNGMQLRDIEKLTFELTGDWDLIESHIDLGAHRVKTPELSPLIRAAELLIDHDPEVAATFTAALTKRLTEVQIWLDQARQAQSTADILAALNAAKNFPWGNAGGKDAADIKQAAQEWKSAAAAEISAVMDSAVRVIAAAVSRQVLAAAQQRRVAGKLTYQDLLVYARRLITGADGAAAQQAATVRAALQQRFAVIMLDEFQDTDPIQLELAVRIAGGADARADSWTDVTVPDGSLFVVGDPKQSIYRFRRANIATYLQAQQHIGETVTLTANFRTTPPIIDWVNAVCARLITASTNTQPAYEKLVAYREGAGSGAPVTILGKNPHSAAESTVSVPEAEAADVAGIIRHALDNGWTIFDEGRGEWRPIEPADIAILVPTDPSIPTIVAALDDAGIAHNSLTGSGSYQAPHIRDLMHVMRAVSDPTDILATVTTLRSALFGCGDDDLFRWKTAGQSFRLDTPLPDDSGGPVADGLAYLADLRRRLRYRTPSQLLSTVAHDRRVLELAATGQQRREQWRQLRYVIDQARAWSESEAGTLRQYLRWVQQQLDESKAVKEARLPETDQDSVVISTVHTAKGLEYGMVILAGMSTTLTASRKSVRWPEQGPAGIRLRSGIETSNFAAENTRDRELDALELRRLMYVATTRARDHLVVSLHRAIPSARVRNGADKAAQETDSVGSYAHQHQLSAKPATSLTRAELLVTAGAADQPMVLNWQGAAAPAPTPERRIASSPPAWEKWLRENTARQQRSQIAAAIAASSLEGSDVAAASGVDRAETVTISPTIIPPVAAVAANGSTPDDVITGRGRSVGLAVHHVLQHYPLRRDGWETSSERADPLLEQLVTQACREQQIMDAFTTITRLAQSALSSDVWQQAAAAPHWRETWVGTTMDDGTVIEGIVDLMYREEDGTVVVVDYKTDAITATDPASRTQALAVRSAFYAPQLRTYLTAVQAATGAPTRGVLLFLRPHAPASAVTINV